MSNDRRELVADWLIIVGAVGLVISLFLPWSHQFSAAFLAQWGASDQLRSVPHDPTAWQVYSSTDVLLALLALALVAAALKGTRRIRAGVAAAAALGLAFTLHALSKPPTNGANIFDPSLSVPNYFPNAPAAGVGETLAVIALVVALIGLVVSFATD
jgi:hypothetical protein